jgi:hypothetical protein
MLRLSILLCCLAAGVAHADAPATYALVIGSNAAGPGQTALRYAEDDARRVGAILTELGGYAPTSVDVVVHPTPVALRDRLTALAARVAADTAAGRQARVFFYYSGHARAEAIDLGVDSLPLAELRERLFALHATLTVIVLDACQSGAFSRIKGAAPTADFSFNSRQQLDARGVAVLASSSGSELSQESEQLRGSYFTHHLLVGMRGAGDANGDGEVSIDEAYRYAYHQTLLATAETAVGGQHVTLEVDLKGHGEVPLSFPRQATATITLPAPLEGEALVSTRGPKAAVVAETHKAKGAAVRIAVAPGEYDVIVRQGSMLERCRVVAPGDVDLARCSRERVEIASHKGGEFLPSWRIAVGGEVGRERDDAFVQTLRDFGYTDDGSSWTLSGEVQREIWLGGAFRGYVGGLASYARAARWHRDTELAPLRFEWGTTTVAATARVEHAITGRSYGYLGGLAGVGIGRSQLHDQNDMTTRNLDVGYALGATAGIGCHDAVYIHGLDFELGARVSRTPVVENDIGQTHDSGGVYLGIGLSYRLGGAR